MTTTVDFADVMLDIETIGHGPDAAIVAIGSVAFSIERAEFRDAPAKFALPHGAAMVGAALIAEEWADEIEKEAA